MIQIITHILSLHFSCTHSGRIKTHINPCCPLCLFSSGRYRPGKNKPDPKTWKANFRCALNSLHDICELPEYSKKRGSNAFRVYKMLPSTQTNRRRRGKTNVDNSHPSVRPHVTSSLSPPLRASAAEQASGNTGQFRSMHTCWYLHHAHMATLNTQSGDKCRGCIQHSNTR